jgi:hypothetical protein
LIEFLNKVNPFPQSQKVTITDLEVHTKFLERSLSANLERRATIELKLKKLSEEKVAIEKEMGNLGSDKNKSKSIVIHLLSGSEKSGLKFGFTYLATAAGWMPQYEAKADYATSKIDFNYLTRRIPHLALSCREKWTSFLMVNPIGFPFPPQMQMLQ